MYVILMTPSTDELLQLGIALLTWNTRMPCIHLTKVKRIVTLHLLAEF